MERNFVDNIDFDQLPGDAFERFVAILSAALDFYSEPLKGDLLSAKHTAIEDVIDIVQTAYDALGDTEGLPRVPEVPLYGTGQLENIEIQKAAQSLFKLQDKLNREIARKRFIAGVRSSDPLMKIEGTTDILEISNSTLVKIHPLLQELRNSVAASSLDEGQKERLEGILNEFEAELNSRKLSQSNTLTKLAAVSAILIGATTFLAEAPDAIATVGQITAYIGSEIEAAKQAQLLAPEAPKLLTKGGPQ